MTQEHLPNEIEILLTGTSGLLASVPPTDGTLQHYALILAQSLGASKVDITTESPSGRAFTGSFKTRSNRAPFLTYSRPLKVQGVARGTLLVELVAPRHDPPTMLTLLDAAFQFLNLFMEHVVATEEHVQLLEQVSMLSTTILHHKRVDRAAGFLASAKGITETQARKHIHAQAVASGRTPIHVANEIISRYASWVPSRRPVPGSPMLKSA